MTTNIIFGCIAIATVIYSVWLGKMLNKTIQSQQETIQKLLNREPVTYKEVDQKPPKPDTDRPIAWGGTIADRDEL